MNKGIILGIGGVVMGMVAVAAAACGADSATTNNQSTADTVAQATAGPRLETAPSFASGSTSAKDAGGSANSVAPGAPASGSTTAPDLPSQIDRKIISNTSLSLSAGDVGAAFNEAQRLARVNGGYTEKSSYANADSNDAKQRSATLTLRVPADKLDDTMTSLRGISGAKVTSEGAKSTEITDQYTDLQSRQRNLERTEQSYLKLLDQAKTVQDILTVNDRLDSVRGQIEQIQGRLNVYDHMADLATIDLTIAPVAPGKATPDEGGPKGFQASFADAWDWSLERAQYVVSGSAAAGAVAVWLVLPVGLVLVAARFARRRSTPTAS